MGFLSFISAVFGWTYFFCWSLSFYPQLLLNWRRRSTSGTTVDLPLINTLGFLAYFTYTSLLYFSLPLRAQYAARNHGTAPTVTANDVAFAAHALVLSLVTVSQYLFPHWLWGFPRDARARHARPSNMAVGLVLGAFVGVGITAVWVLAAPSSPSRNSQEQNPLVWNALDLIYAISYVKLLVTLVKYFPQVLANHRNRATRGFSIWQPLLDLAGGLLSIAQLGIDSYLIGDWSGVTGNPVKLALGNVSMVYDFVFMAQHYVLYPDRGGLDDDREGQRRVGGRRHEEDENRAGRLD